MRDRPPRRRRPGSSPPARGRPAPRSTAARAPARAGADRRCRSCPRARPRRERLDRHRLPGSSTATGEAAGAASYARLRSARGASSYSSDSIGTIRARHPPEAAGARPRRTAGVGASPRAAARRAGTPRRGSGGRSACGRPRRLPRGAARRPRGGSSPARASPAPPRRRPALRAPSGRKRPARSPPGRAPGVPAVRSVPSR